MTTDEPYFMTEKTWYRFNEEEWKYELTDLAPEEAVKSYEEYYKLFDK